MEARKRHGRPALPNSGFGGVTGVVSVETRLGEGVWRLAAARSPAVTRVQRGGGAERPVLPAAADALARPAPPAGAGLTPRDACGDMRALVSRLCGSAPCPQSDLEPAKN